MTSEEILQQFLAAQQQQNKWNSPQNLINLATLGLGGLSGFAGANSADQANQLTAEQIAYNKAQDAYLRRMQARTGLSAAIRGTLDDRNAAALNFADRSPLGTEQMLTSSMARARGLSDVAENFKPSTPTDPNILGSFNPGSNILGAFTTPDYRASISPEATERSIAERRKALSFINPDFQFGSTSSYGLPGATDNEVETNRFNVGADRLNRENQLYQLLTAQMQEASQPLYQESVPQAAAQPEKKKGFWSKLGSALLPIAGVAANFIPGVGPLAGIALSGLGGAAGGALSGGVKGAVLGGLGGASAGYGVNAAGMGGTAKGWSPFGSGAAGVQAGFEGPNLANYGMLPGGFDASTVMMPGVPSFQPPVYSQPNQGIQSVPGSVNQNPSLVQQAIRGASRNLMPPGPQMAPMRPVPSHGPQTPNGQLMIDEKGQSKWVPASQVQAHLAAGFRFPNQSATGFNGFIQ